MRKIPFNIKENEMKHTGTIEIDCGDMDCSKCRFSDTIYKSNFKEISYIECTLFNTRHPNKERLPQCLETFKPEISEGKVRQEMAGGSDEEMLDTFRKHIDNVIKEISPELYKLMKENKNVC
jgi:hypothetical protein